MYPLASHKRLSALDLPNFQGTTLFDRIGRVLCEAACIPRKEFYESWEVARRARRRFRGGRVVDMPCGHGLVGYLMLLLDDTSPGALLVDRSLPPSAERVAQALEAAWPRLEGRVQRVQGDIEDTVLHPGDVVVSAHACGGLTDLVLERAVAASARVAVLPCCHSTAKNDAGGLSGWLDAALAIDVTRAATLRAGGYRVHTQTIPEEITPKNRLLFGMPPKGEGSDPGQQPSNS